MSQLHVVVDRDRCEGTGNCAFYAPNTFDLSDDATVELLTAVGSTDASGDSGDSDDEVRVAVASCPVRALSITDHGVR